MNTNLSVNSRTYSDKPPLAPTTTINKLDYFPAAKVNYMRLNGLRHAAKRIQDHTASQKPAALISNYITASKHVSWGTVTVYQFKPKNSTALVNPRKKGWYNKIIHHLTFMHNQRHQFSKNLNQPVNQVKNLFDYPKDFNVTFSNKSRELSRNQNIYINPKLPSIVSKSTGATQLAVKKPMRDLRSLSRNEQGIRPNAQVQPVITLGAYRYGLIGKTKAPHSRSHSKQSTNSDNKLT